jgi:hypothetical protein
MPVTHWKGIRAGGNQSHISRPVLKV